MSYRRAYGSVPSTGANPRTGSFRDAPWSSRVGSSGSDDRGYARSRYDPRNARGTDTDSNTPSLAVRLMQVAGEYELERKEEVKRLHAEVENLRSRNESLQREKASAERQVDSLSRKLSQAQLEAEQAQQEKSSDTEGLRQEILTLRFALARTGSELQAFKSHYSSADIGTSRLDKQALDAVLKLQRAIDEQNKEAISSLCHEDALYTRTALCAAARAGRDDVCQYILSPRVSETHSATLKSSLNAALRNAAQEGRTRTAKQMIQLGAAVNEVSDEDLQGRTPLHIACLSGNENVVKLLLSKGEADVWKRDTRGNNCLHLAAFSNKGAIAKIMMLQGCDTKTVNEDGLSPEEVADKHSSTSVLEHLKDADLKFWNASVRANKLYNLKDFERAMKEYTVALECAPNCKARASPRDLATLYYNRARAAYRMAHHCQAIDDCDRALESDSSYRNALAQRAECHMALFEFEKAAKDFESLLDSDPTDRQWERRKDDAEMMRDISHYTALGISRSATNSQIKKAFRQQCLKWHPDKHTSSQEASKRATIVFTKINTAYETLTDSYKRMMYDVELRNKLTPKDGQEVGFEQWYEKEMQREQERAKERESMLQSLREKEQKEEQARIERLEELRQQEKQSGDKQPEESMRNSVCTPKRGESKASLIEKKSDKEEDTRGPVQEVPSYPSFSRPDEQSSRSSTSTSPATADSATENKPPERESYEPGKPSNSGKKYTSSGTYGNHRSENDDQQSASKSFSAMSQLLDALQGLGLPTENLSSRDWDELSETAAAVAKEANENGESSATVEQLLAAALQEGRAQLDRLGINIDDDDDEARARPSASSATAHPGQFSTGEYLPRYQFSDDSEDESTEEESGTSDLSDDPDNELTFEEINREFGKTFENGNVGKASSREPAVPNDDIINELTSKYRNERRKVEQKMGSSTVEST